ncbi:MAG: phage portal protein [Thiotrichales bacterium]|nr:phage portal protein [Thiotrichales bacterium]
MALRDWFTRAKSSVDSTAARRENIRNHSPNPFASVRPVRTRNFAAANTGRLFANWQTHFGDINNYLVSQLHIVRSRSREQVVNNSYGRRYVSIMKSNVVGEVGVTVQAQTMRGIGKNKKLDTDANDAIEGAYKDWASRHCDYFGAASLLDFQNLAISSPCTDGEYLFIEHNEGEYGYQLENVDPERLDTSRNQTERNGDITCMGVTRNAKGHRVRYWLREIVGQSAGYISYSLTRSTPLDANRVIHGFVPEWPNQMRGIPWMVAALPSMQLLDKYDVAALAAARAGAEKLGVYYSETGAESIGGSEDENGAQIQDSEIAAFEQLPAGIIDFKTYDPTYPHAMYADFHKAMVRRISSGLDLSYHVLANDLEGVNFSSSRTGTLEDRGLFRQRQAWLINSLLTRVYERWLINAVLRKKIRIGSRPLAHPVDEYLTAKFQPRRWDWVDPLKDLKANQGAIELKLKSRSQVIRDGGGDPDSVWREIQREDAQLAKMGLLKPEDANSGQI